MALPPPERRSPPVDPNGQAALEERRDAGTLTWRGAALMLPARTAFAVAAQVVVAAILASQGAPAPWQDAGRWLPVYGTAVDLGCLTLLWRLTRREGIGAFALARFDRTRLGRDVLYGLALIPVSLVFIFAGTYAASWLVYGTVRQPYFLGGLPLPAVLYGTLVWPFIWGITEQMNYNGYLVSRVQVLARNTTAAVVIVALVWSLQHAFMPLTFDVPFMTFRFLASVPSSVFETLLYLRYRRLLPLAVAHALMDGATVVIPAIAR